MDDTAKIGADTLDFLHDLRWRDVPEPARYWAKRCVLDLIAVAAAGHGTDLGRIVRGHAAAQFGAGERGARLWFDGRTMSPAGAALANGMTIDAIDAHDGWRPSKGHAGCGLLPAALAFAEAEGREDGAEFLTGIALGYELACRAGAALHASVPDYHTSGAWVAVACAALGARAMGLDRERTREAMGIAEYHGPRSQMMRCIDHPTMVKDGSGWGAMAGVSAAYLARDGFTGAPAITVEAPEVAAYWADLGAKWLIAEQYFKPIPVCRWAQPAVFAAMTLAETHGVRGADVEKVEVEAFHAAVRLATRHPATTEQAQYSLPFPLAAGLVLGSVGPETVTGAALRDPEIASLADRVEMREGDYFNAQFPAKRISAVTLVLKDGRRLESGPQEAPGDPETPLSEAELDAKYRRYMAFRVAEERSERVRTAVLALETAGVGALLAALCPAAG